MASCEKVVSQSGISVLYLPMLVFIFFNNMAVKHIINLEKLGEVFIPTKQLNPTT